MRCTTFSIKINYGIGYYVLLITKNGVKRVLNVIELLLLLSRICHLSI